MKRLHFLGLNICLMIGALNAGSEMKQAAPVGMRKAVQEEMLKPQSYLGQIPADIKQLIAEKTFILPLGAEEYPNDDRTIIRRTVTETDGQQKIEYTKVFTHVKDKKLMTLDTRSFITCTFYPQGDKQLQIEPGKITCFGTLDGVFPIKDGAKKEQKFNELASQFEQKKSAASTPTKK